MYAQVGGEVAQVGDGVAQVGDGVAQVGDGVGHDNVQAFQGVAGTVAAYSVQVAAETDPDASFVGVAVEIAFGQDAVDIAFVDDLGTGVGVAETVAAGAAAAGADILVEEVLLEDKLAGLGSKHEPSMWKKGVPTAVDHLNSPSFLLAVKKIKILEK